MEKAKVTILLAAYKGVEYAGAQIESILAQDCGGWQLVLSDDGEDTAELLESYAAAHPERIRHIRSGRRFGSAQKHFMYLLEHYGLETPYVMFSDQDDVWHPDKVRKTLALMEETETDPSLPVLVHTDLKVVDGELKEIAPSFLDFSKMDGSRLAFHELLVQNVVTGCTVMINRPLAQLALKGAGRPEMCMHDWWMALAAARFGSISCLEEPLVQYRQHGINSIGAKKLGKEYIFERVTHGKDVRDALEATRVQARYASEVFALGPDDVITQYGRLSDRNKAERLRFYARHRIFKSGPARNVGLLLWG